MATTRTRRDLVNAALAALGILAAGQNAAAEDFEEMDDHVEPLLAWLRSAEILDLEDPDEIPLEFFADVANLLADQAASTFGLVGVPPSSSNPNPVQGALDNIRLVTYSRPTYERQKTEYY